MGGGEEHNGLREKGGRAGVAAVLRSHTWPIGAHLALSAGRRPDCVMAFSASCNSFIGALQVVAPHASANPSCNWSIFGIRRPSAPTSGNFMNIKSNGSAFNLGWLINLCFASNCFRLDSICACHRATKPSSSYDFTRSFKDNPVRVRKTSLVLLFTVASRTLYAFLGAKAKFSPKTSPSRRSPMKKLPFQISAVPLAMR
mmetsp:Transcript_94792/g.265422  ORF Transcript_94792/g.265422 Transcript_94792/m.265422 type:complete len:200 (+) Transcript_94792:165-764(+)